MNALGKYCFQIIAAALFAALGGVALCVYFEVPLTVRASAASPGKKATAASVQVCEHHAAQKAKAQTDGTCEHHATPQKNQARGQCEHHASHQTGATRQAACEHHVAGSDQQCQHEGGACCAEHSQAASFELPPGHPPVPGYTVAKTNSTTRSAAKPVATEIQY